jgi:predicted permease
MSPIRPILSRLRALFLRRRLERDMAAELQAHFEMQEAANRASGMSSQEAHYAALRQFGHLDSVKETARDQRSWVWLEQLGKDFLLAVRTLRRNRASSAVAIATLAVGIAATASLFSLVNGLVRDPLPYPEAAQLAPVWKKNLGTPFDWMQLSTLEVLDLQERAKSFADLGAFSVRRFNLGGDRAEAVEGAVCTAGLFRTLGVPPLLGRWFLPEDEASDDAAPVVLSYALWKQHFGADPKCLGRAVRLDGHDHTVVGVMPENFALLSLFTRNRPLGLWTLLTLRRDAGGGGGWLSVLARLRPGVTGGQVSEELKTIARQIPEEDPSRDSHTTFWSMPLVAELGGFPALRVSVLLGAGWALLTLAAQNVAGIMLARGIGRQPEMAVRLALGARRGHILQLVLMESLLVSLLAGLGGFLLALWGQSLLAGLLPVEVLPRAGLHVDASLVGGIAVLILVSTQMVGLAPALLASKTDVVSSIKEGGTSSGPARKTQRKLRRLVVGQVVVALLLVAVAVQLSSTYRDMLGSSQAQVSDNILTAAVAVKGPAYQGEEARLAFWKRLLDACGALPGVRDVAVTSKLPMGGWATAGGVQIDDKPIDPRVPPWAEESYVSPGFFAAIDARLVQGRLLAREDELRQRSAVVINRTMARRFWPGENPVGRHVRWAGPNPTWSAEVVGVIEDVRQAPERSTRPEMYFPFTDAPFPESFLVVRTEAGLAAPVGTIRRELARIDRDLALGDPQTLGARIENQGRVLAVVTTVVDGLTVAIIGLAALGMYGTLSFHFARRRREIGLRVALGASPRDIVRLVLKQAGAWVAMGLGVGMGGAWLLSTFLRRMMEQASAFDFAGVAVGAVVIFFVALLAAWLPARRMMNVNPVEAFRAE